MTNTNANNNADNKTSNSHVIFWIISVLFMLGGIICIVFYVRNPKVWGGHMSLIGSLISIVGLTIAIWQIIQAKEAAINSSVMAEKAKEAVATNTKEINKYLSYASVSQCERLVDEIESFLHSKNNDRLLLRLKELKDSLIDIKVNPRISQVVSRRLREYNKLLHDIESDILSVEKASNPSSSAELQYDIIFNHVEKIKTNLTNIASELKYEKL